MNRLTRTLIRLYPGGWRKRYGAEFEAMLEQVPPGWSANFDLFKGSIRMQFSQTGGDAFRGRPACGPRGVLYGDPEIHLRRDARL
jgi:hypothetical protein